MRRLKILSKEELEKLTTPRLLAYKTRLLKVRDYNCYCGDPSCTVRSEENPDELNKSHPTWQNLFNLVKQILLTREHVERKDKKH